MTQKTANASNRTDKPGRSAQYWRSFVDSLDDGLAIIDRDFGITYANTAVRKKYRLDSSTLAGQSCHKLFHGLDKPCTPAEWECAVSKAWNTGKPARSIHTHLVPGEDDGEEEYVEVKAFPLRDSHGDITSAVLLIRDITEAKSMERQIVEANRNLLALNVIANAVSQSLDLDEILNSALDKVLELMKGDIGGILLLDQQTQTLSYRVYRGLSKEFVQSIAGLKLGEGIAGTAAQRGEPIYVDNISEDPRLTRSVVIKEGLRAFASVPLISKNQVLGVMNVASYTLRRFTPEDVQLLSSIGNQIAVAIESARLYEELQQKQEMRGELLHLVISTQEEERRRIARGLHDETSQALTSLAVKLEAVAGTLPPDAEQTKAKLKEIQSIALGTLGEIHNVIYELRPTLLDDLGLIPAIKWHAENYLETAGIKAHLETAGQERRLPPEIETALFRIVQEATTNTVRHAHARSASISLEFEESSVAVHIEDDGRGFDPNEVAKAKDSGRGLGLLSMKERVEHLGGVLSIMSEPGKGTQIQIEIPVNWEEVSNV